jgi:hypothetical protein
MNQLISGLGRKKKKAALNIRTAFKYIVIQYYFFVNLMLEIPLAV